MQLALILGRRLLGAAALIAVVLALNFILIRIARASMLDVLGADYIRTARARGLSESAVLWRHALRDALLPVVTLSGLQFGSMLSGAVLVETVFD